MDWRDVRGTNEHARPTILLRSRFQDLLDVFKFRLLKETVNNIAF